MRSRRGKKLRKLVRDPVAFARDSWLLRNTPLGAKRPGVASHAAPRPAPAPDRAERASVTRFERYFGQEVCGARPFYNFGAGSWSHPLFRNIDIVDPNYPDNRPDIVYDAFEVEDLPIPSRSAELFYFCHVNEHLTDAVNRKVLAEVARCLRPGGVLRIVYPDVDTAYRAYQSDDREFFVHDWARGKKSVEERSSHPIAQLLLDFFATRAQIGSPRDGNRKYSADEFEALIDELGLEGACEVVAAGMLVKPQRDRPNTHITWWNHAKFTRVLGELGFVAVTRSAYLQSSVPPLRDAHYFDLVFPHMSGYVEARMPSE